MEHGEGDGPLHRELEAPVLKQPVQRGVQAQFFPETAEHQVRPDMAQGSGFQAPVLLALDYPDAGGKIISFIVKS